MKGLKNKVKIFVIVLETENELVLPEISDFDKLIKSNLKNQEILSRGKPQTSNNSKMTINASILNTPLYRFYAETNKFETLNMIKPIKINQRKAMDISE